MDYLKLLYGLLFRNQFCRNGNRIKNYRVNLEYFDSCVNLGDALAPVICEWMLSKKKISLKSKSKRTAHLMTVGSIIGGSGFFDATIWGSGIKSFDAISKIGKTKYFQKFDIRAVRGPITREILCTCGYKCPEVYGDPAILMPLIYKPSKRLMNESPKTGIILHFSTIDFPDIGAELIDIKTADYKKFIDHICKMDKIISSSLHGIILAESYGIPAVFLCENREAEMMKYYDYYYSTGRKNVRLASNIEEAMAMQPMKLPNLCKMQENLLKTFPYDLWE